jgi:hypothetical protein
MTIKLCNMCENQLKRKQNKFCSNECRINSLKKFGTSHFFTDESKKKLSFKRSDETKEKNRLAALSENCKLHGEYICNRCNKIYDTNTSLRAHKASCGHQKEKSICEICNIEFNSKTGLNIHNNSMHIKTDDEKNIMSSKMRDAKLKLGSRIRKTSIQEDKFYEELILLFNEVQRNFKIVNFYHVYDFFIPSHNLIIEFDGDFWHGNSEKFLLSSRMKKQYHLDENSFEYAKNNNYNILRIWSSTSTQFLEKVKECLLKQEKLKLEQFEMVVRKEFSILE